MKDQFGQTDQPIILKRLLAHLSHSCLPALPGCPQARRPSTQNGDAPSHEIAGSGTDLFVMFGSVVDRSGRVPRANYNIGIGHTLGFLKKDPIAAS
jgi:hypothetical protein